MSWFRRREQPSPFEAQDRFYGLSQVEFNQLATYNGERARGLTHDAVYQEYMARLQASYNKAVRAEADAWNAKARAIVKGGR